MPEPIILSTWTMGAKANAAGWPYLTAARPSSLDAVEQACRRIEADPEIASVGLGGMPDRSGEVSLDAAIMLSPSHCGAVCCVRRFTHAVSLARRVMERTPHMILCGDGADRFAGLNGFEPNDLLTDEARAAWQNWSADHPGARRLEAAGYLPPANVEEVPIPKPPNSAAEEPGHDTVGVLALDAAGQLAGACSTSGLPFKVPGRVGDSGIIGHGLYVDPRYGAAVATGVGELVMGVCGTFLAVELMRRGLSPRDAAVEVLARIAENYTLREEHQVALIALDPAGHWSAAALRPGFHVAVRTAGRDELVDPESVLMQG
ncbi:MAG: N(4)-(beta-N-acetylglucosaminyl)-L-asparaginase [Thermoguttaceae bacterium]|jgi:isoaspartyl peptidase/L-asparaginase-like protein (Ntn-hydrolase superfamily)